MISQSASVHVFTNGYVSLSVASNNVITCSSHLKENYNCFSVVVKSAIKVELFACCNYFARGDCLAHCIDDFSELFYHQWMSECVIHSVVF